jgi:RNA polymerase sigma factor (sigma-70 family)
MEQPELIPHLFRTEFRKIVAVLCRNFGLDKLEMAEDIAGETFLAAMETWPYQGVPPSPVGWLHTVARNKAISLLRRNNNFRGKVAPELLKESEGLDLLPEIDLSDVHIRDSQLRMIFAVCHPSIPPESQVALALRILCGFSAGEIALAFLTNPETISKRIYRAKEKLRDGKVTLDLPHGQAMGERLGSVLTTLYLLFNEGYHSVSGHLPFRQELCEEAMRLTQLLLEEPETCRPEVQALYALMCFHSSRFAARSSETGDPVMLTDQDPSLWDPQLITRGSWYLREASRGAHLSKYHLEAAIAYWHAQPDAGEGKWAQILPLFDRLVEQDGSPVVALNRLYALAMVKGKAAALREAVQLDLPANPYHHSLLAWLLEGTDDEKAASHLERALELARNPADRQALMKRMEEREG